MPTEKKLLIFYLITTLGYSITSLATFLSLEINFHGIMYVGVALSLRTFSTAVFGYSVNHIIQKINFRTCFILAQLLGIISIISIYFGFEQHFFLAVLIGVASIGIPSTLSTILLTITFKINSETKTYRKYSGARELVFGVARLAACLLTPFLLMKANLNGILIFNLATYFIGILFLLNLDFNLYSKKKSANPAIKINHLILKSKKTWIYVCQTCSSLMLAAFIPLLSSSQQMPMAKHLPILLRQSLWSIEAATMILGSAVYLCAKKIREHEIAKGALMLNGALLFLFFLPEKTFVTLSVTALISVLMMLSFYVFRDDYVISAASNTRLVEAHAAFSSVQRDIMYGVSPVFLTCLFTEFKISVSILLILTLQLAFYLVYRFLTSNKEKSIGCQEVG